MPDVTTTSSTQMPAWVTPYAQGYLQRAQSVADMPYQAYQGQRVADLNPYQTQAYQGMYQRAMQGSPVMGAAEGALTGMMDGNYQQATQNPYGRVQATGGGAQISATRNPYGNVSAGTNPYAGSNPYLQQQIDAAQSDVMRAWNTGAKPQWDAAMQRSGSFGNSGLQQMQQQAASDVQRNLGNISSGMRMQDYTQQQQLGESALNRNLQAQQFNAGLGENYANRAFTAQQYNSGLGESAANRALQASTTNAGLGEQWAGRNDSQYGAAQSRALQSMGMAPTYANQDYADLNAMLSAGQGLQTQNQRYLDDSYNRFLESRNYPQQQLDVMRNALGGVNFGSNTTQTSSGTSTASSLLGGALTGASLYNMLFGGR